MKASRALAVLSATGVLAACQIRTPVEMDMNEIAALPTRPTEAVVSNGGSTLRQPTGSPLECATFIKKAENIGVQVTEASCVQPGQSEILRYNSANQKFTGYLPR